jgi:Tol biopolymer transport system component
VFIKGGAEIVFTTLESPAQLSLMRLKLADGTVERLHPGASTSEFEAGFSADGRIYAFVQSRGNLNLKLVIRDTKENRDAVFDPGGGFAGMHRPAIATDGSRIVFGLPNAAGQQLVSVNNEGKDRKDLTQTGFNNWPAYSPDGRRLAFGSSRDGDFEIYTMNADGSEVQRLTHSPGLDVRPAWSPDGRRLAFTSNRDGCYQVYVMSAEGSSARPLRRSDEREDYPAWHPDGKRLVLVAERAGRSDLFLVEVPN